MNGSDEPVRLRDDAGAPDALRAALARAAASRPLAYDTARGLERFRAQLALGATTNAASFWTRGRGWGAGAIGLAVLLVALLGARAALRPTARAPGATVALAGGRSASGSTASRPIAPAARPRDGRSVDPVTAPVPAEPRAAATEAIVALPHVSSSHGVAFGTLHGRGTGAVVPRLATATRATNRAATARATREVDAGTEASLEMLRAGGEDHELEWANGVLASDPARALALAEQGDREFPASPRREERDALAVGALVRLRRFDDARVRATRFLAQWPRGAFSATVRQLLVQSSYAGRGR